MGAALQLQQLLLLPPLQLLQLLLPPSQLQLPGWPCQWDVHFKLRAPRNTTVEGVWKGGKLLNLTVVPAWRMPWVQVAPGC